MGITYTFFVHTQTKGELKVKTSQKFSNEVV